MSTSLGEQLAARGGYVGIADALRSQITRGELTANEQLPSIGELARRYGATVITVRRALRLLEEEGLVSVKHGVGAFVGDWSQPYDAVHLPSFSTEMAVQHRRLETEVLAREEAVRHAQAAAALLLPEGSPLAKLARLRRVDRSPVAYQCSYLPYGLREVIREYGPHASLYERLRERTGRLPAGADEALRAVALPEPAARLLEREPGAVGWMSRRTTFSAAGEPLVYDEAFLPGDRVELALRRRPGSSTTQYEILPVDGD